MIKFHRLNVLILLTSFSSDVFFIKPMRNVEESDYYFNNAGDGEDGSLLTFILGEKVLF